MGGGGYRVEGDKGEKKWDNCNSIINKICFKNKIHANNMKSGICFKIWGQKKEWKVVETGLAKWQNIELKLDHGYMGLIMLFCICLK